MGAEQFDDALAQSGWLALATRGERTRTRALPHGRAEHLDHWYVPYVGGSALPAVGRRAPAERAVRFVQCYPWTTLWIAAATTLNLVLLIVLVVR